ncbi:hypothetical protein DsansV1_C04g0042591 [Dioscorea sansibarensis]
MAVIRKVLIVPIKASYRVARDHPFVLVWMFIMLLLRRYLPTVFAFLVSSSPVIICTALLLGTILIYGEPNIPEIDEETKDAREISSLRAKNARNVFVGKKDDGFNGKDHEDRGQDGDEGDNDDRFTGSTSTVKKDRRILDKKKMPKEVEILYQGVIEKRELLREHEYANGVSTKSRPKQSKCIGVDIDEHDTCSGSESDHAEDSSHAAAFVDGVLPIIDELHPLLKSERRKRALKSADNSDAVSSSSEDDDESDDVSADGEIAEEEEEEEDDGGGADEKDDGTEAVLKWTADDQKNLMDLGSSELERNQRLENLIAKRIARKRFQTERNLIDLESNNIDPIMEQLSTLQVQIRSRQNPFDLPYGSEESIDLPPIPGSAPSILLPRRNPFDLPEDIVGESSAATPDRAYHPGFVSPVPQKDIFFRRHESFSVGPSSFAGELKQGMSVSRFRPYFVTERMDSEESSFAALQGQLSGNGDMEASSAAGSDSTSSVVDQEDDKELVEQENHQESVVLSPGDHASELVEVGSQTSEEVESLDVEQEQNMVNMDDDNNIAANASNVTTEAHQDVHEIEEDFDDSSSSSSSKASDNNLKMSITGEQSATAEQIKDDYPDASSNSNQSVILGSNPESIKADRVDESQVEDPVYDSSPSAIEKSSSNIASLEEDLFPGDVHIETSEFGLLPRSDEENVSSENGTLSSSHVNTTENSMPNNGGGLWVASPSLNFVEQNESRSREVSMIAEHDVIGRGFPKVEPILPLIPEQIAARLARHSSLSSATTDSSEDVNVDAGVGSGS